jgi:hypothetical protein
MTDPHIYHGLLICGMSPSTAGRYLVVRNQIEMIIEKVNKAGHWLGDFEKVRTEGICKTLAGVGRMLTHEMAQLEDYLDNEFVSMEKLRAEADELTRMDING